MQEITSNVNALGIVFTVCMCLLLLVVPHKYALIPIALTACYMTFGQQLVLMNLHFTMLRVLVIVGVLRILTRGGIGRMKWQRIDWILIAWMLSSIIIYTMLWQTSEAFVNRLGLAYDAIGLYIFFRCHLRTIDDVRMAVTIFTVALAPLAVLMSIEKATGSNIFAGFGGVPESTVVREGVRRCQGPFSHPILAGTFGATWLPLCMSLWWQGGRYKVLSIVGTISSATIIFLAGSSGPVGALVIGVLAIHSWVFRSHMRLVRWSILVGILILHVTMTAPVWFIFARVGVFGGSTGWHRANLIDQTLAHFNEWWLLGTKSIRTWGVWASDITNQFILEGIRGGLITMVLFIAICVIALSYIGRGMRRLDSMPRRDGRLLWGIGCTMVVHVTNFFNVSYFDQNIVNWYLVLAMASVALNVPRLAKREMPGRESAPAGHSQFGVSLDQSKARLKMSELQF